MHTLLYLMRSSPWRSIAFGIGAQTMLVITGRIAAHVLPSASITVQVVINAPIALQWMIGLVTLSAITEQRHRYDQVALAQGAQTLRAELEDV